MVERAHISVLAREVVAILEPRASGLYCDLTLGAGGHAELILEASAPDGRLIGFDRDASALELARERLARFGTRVQFVHARFGDLAAALKALGVDKCDGLLCDLGVSSMQLDRGERGFSFSKEGPLDMRMDQDAGQPLSVALRALDIDTLKNILWDFGEERFAGRVARAIVESFDRDEIVTTADLARVASEALPARERRERTHHPATRTFQALRIWLNGELDELKSLLQVFPQLLSTGGRFAAISFHSLEDRLVKHRFRELEWTSRLPDDLAIKAGERIRPVVRTLTNKPIEASEEELSLNPRSRSAKLRACERTEAAL